VITGIVGAIVLGLVFAVVVAIAKDRGPGPDDVAVAYEWAWDRLDFDAVFTLSGQERRDGLDREAFIAAKRAAYEHQHALAGLVTRVGIDELARGRESAVALTRIDLRDGTVANHQVELMHRNGRWEVIVYRLTPAPDDTTRTTG
jgi:hypothetical protein